MKFLVLGAMYFIFVLKTTISHLLYSLILMSPYLYQTCQLFLQTPQEMFIRDCFMHRIKTSLTNKDSSNKKLI